MLFPQLSRPSNQSLLTLFTCTRCPSASVWLYDRKEGSGGRSRLHRQLVLVKKATLGFTPHRAPAQSLEENRARRIRCATRLRVAVRHHSTAVRTSVVYLYDALRSTRDGAGAGVTQRTGMWRWLAGGGSGPVQLSQGGRHRVRAAHSRRPDAVEAGWTQLWRWTRSLPRGEGNETIQTPCVCGGRGQVVQGGMGRREEAWKKLFLAATSGDVKRVRELVALGADVNQQGANGWTMLHTAAYQGHVEVASALVEAGADCALVTPGGSTALALSLESGHDHVAEVLQAAATAAAATATQAGGH
jgi:hypothetical protein